MKNANGTYTLKSRTLGLALAAALIPALASANGHTAPSARKDLSGHVEVVHQVPGGTVTVGAEWGKQHRPQPTVVVVEQRPQVVVVEREIRGRHQHGRKVVLVREQPRRITAIERAPRREVVVVEKRGLRGNAYGKPSRIVERVSYHDKGGNGGSRYRQETREVILRDDRDGHSRNVYVRR
jgi:hypothetical protein